MRRKVFRRLCIGAVWFAVAVSPAASSLASEKALPAPDQAAFAAASENGVRTEEVLSMVDGSGGELLRLGSELNDGIEVAAPGRFVVEKAP